MATRRKVEAEAESEERWLLTYADMLTLMFALFMVLFSISSVNVSKFHSLSESLKSAFSGSILPGGKSVMQTGSQVNTTQHAPGTAAVPSIVPLTPSIPKPGDTSATQISKAMLSSAGSTQEQSEFAKLQHKLNHYADTHGFGRQVHAIITKQGLVVRVLTDKLLFDSGSATLQSAGDPLLDEVADLLKNDDQHPITVEGNTDNQPIHTAQFPSNWDLSSARAIAVLQYFISRGVPQPELGVAAYADLHPVASNATIAGRSQNRRVDIVLNRLYPDPSP